MRISAREACVKPYLRTRSDISNHTACAIARIQIIQLLHLEPGEKHCMLNRVAQKQLIFLLSVPHLDLCYS